MHYIHIYSCPPGKVDHTETLVRFAIAICEIWAAKMFKFIYFSFFLLKECEDLALDYSFHTLCKSGYEMQMRNLNTLKFGRDKEHTCKGKSTQTQPSCKKECSLQKPGWKSCEIKGGGHEMAAMLLMLTNFNNDCALI